jgi:gamma-glutamyl:cysteine ligase YbdK (ATP-grasp superfamily)
LANKDQVTNELPNQETEGLALADDRARLQADIHAAAWRIDQLLSVLNENSDAQEKMTSLKSQLSQAETRLNEQAVLLNQLECDAHRS